MEDFRQNAQRTKLEISEGYLFISLKQMVCNDSGELSADDLALFVRSDFLVTVRCAPVTLLEPLRNSREELRPVVNAPRSAVLANIGEARATLLELRRVLNTMRHIIVQLRHVSSPLIKQELSPFLRDVHDDLAIILAALPANRDRLAGTLYLYTSSIANRNAEATKTFTRLGTAALPGLVIASIFGKSHPCS